MPQTERGSVEAMWRFYLATTPRVLRGPATPGFQRFIFAIFAVGFAAFTVLVASIVVTRA